MKTKTFTIWVCILLGLIITVTVLGFLKKPDNSQIASNVKRAFEAKATIKLKDITLVGDVNKTKDNTCTVTIQSPENLKGMKISYDGKDIVVGFKGLNVNLNGDSKLVNSIAKIIVNSIDNVNDDIGVKIDDDTLKLNGKSDTGRFNMTLSKTNRSIMSLSVPELDFECEFDDFIFKSPPQKTKTTN